MELANALLALGGDRATTVPKYNITPAEVAILCAIHGDDAVFDIEPTGESTQRSNPDEIERLLMLYPAKDEDGVLIVTKVYPGRGAILHRQFVDLGLSDALFKVSERVAPAPAKRAKAAKAEPKPAPLDVPGSADHLFDEEV